MTFHAANFAGYNSAESDSIALRQQFLKSQYYMDGLPTYIPISSVHRHVGTTGHTSSLGNRYRLGCIRRVISFQMISWSSSYWGGICSAGNGQYSDHVEAGLAMHDRCRGANSLSVSRRKLMAWCDARISCSAISSASFQKTQVVSILACGSDPVR